MLDDGGGSSGRLLEAIGQGGVADEQGRLLAQGWTAHLGEGDGVCEGGGSYGGGCS